MNNPAVSTNLRNKVEEIARNHTPSPEVAEAITVLNEQKLKHELLPGIAPIWHVDLQKMKVKEPSYLVDQLIGEGCINLVSGLPDSHKSFTVSEALRCISLGIPFLGVFQTKRTKGLIIDEENSLGRSKLRMSLLSEEALDIAILAEQHLKIDENGTAEAIIKYCKANDIGVVVFDSLTSFHSAEENSNSQMAAVFERFMLIKQAWITVIIIVHEAKGSRKDQDNASPRGAGDIWGKCDVQLSLRHIGGDTNRISVKQLKNRDGDRHDFTIAVHREEGRTWFEYVGEVPERLSKDEQSEPEIYEFVIANGRTAQSDVIEAFSGKLGATLVAKILDKLAEDGKLVPITGAHGKKFFDVPAESVDE